MRVGVFVGIQYGLDVVSKFLGRLIELTSSEGVEWYALNSDQGELGLRPISRDVDLVVVFGGDGSLLRFIQTHEDLVDKPILHIGAGRVNFLSEVLVTEDPYSVLDVFRGRYVTDERPLLGATLDDSGHCYALNEITVKCMDPGRTIGITVYEDGEELISGRMDGILIATPTGSTAYNLALGGPVIDYRVRAKIIMPIAPFTRTAVPIVHPYDVEVTVVSQEPAYVICDGFIKGKASKIRVSPWRGVVRLVRVRKMSMYERLRKRLLRP